MSGTAWAWPWWTVMVLVNIVNVLLCAHFFRQSARSPDGDSTYLRRMRIMGLVFTLVALYRAIFVSRYLYQFAWFDTIANSSLLIRMFAWGAELSFAGLIALAMLRFSDDLPGDRHGLATRYERCAPVILFACIFVAQFFAMGGLVTKSRLSFAIEETLWFAGFLAILPAAAMQFRRVFPRAPAQFGDRASMLRSFGAINFGWCLIYCSYGLVYHLPTEYWSVALQQLETGIPEIKTGMRAVVDAFTLVNVTQEYSDWGAGFVLWHSAYFSICVWLAIFFMRAPRLLPPERGDRAR